MISRMVMIGCAGLLVLFLVWQVIGGISLAMSQESLSGKVGEVWNQVQRAGELLPRIESQLLFAYKDRQQLQDKISAARNDILAAKQSGTDEAKMQAVESSYFALKAFAEAPIPDLSDLQRGVLDETSGSFNRITYARGQLIEAQVGFNQTRILFVPVGLIFPHQTVLGSQANPAETLAPSLFQPEQ